MESDTHVRQTRRGSVAAAHRQNTWIMNWLVRTQPCAICGGSLLDGYNPRYPGKSLTLHHTQGSREVDRWDDPSYVANMVLAHKTCHRSYHLKVRHAEAGRNVNTEELDKMEHSIKLAVKRQQAMVIK